MRKFHTFIWIPTQRRMCHLSPASLMTQMGRNAAAGLPSHDVDELIDWCLAWFWAMCESMKLWAFNLTPYNALFYFCLSYLLILWTLNKSHCVACSRILPVSVFCVLQGSGVTPLKCVEIYDMDLLQWKKWKSINICQSYERMCSGTIFYWDTVYNVMITKISITIEALFQPKIH